MSRLLGDVPDGKYIEPGDRQLVKVVKQEQTISSTKNPMMVYTLQDVAGRTIRVYCSLSDDALWKLKTFVAACGVPADKLPLFDVDNPRHHAALVGKQLYIDVVPPESGRKYPDIARWYSLAGKTMQAAQREAQEEIVHELGPPEDEIPF